MPTLAIFTYELRGLLASWLVRLWLVATVLLAFFTVGGNWGRLESAPLIASLLFSYLVFPWFLVVIVLGISPITGARLESLADGILSRPVTRYEYLLASWAARVAIVLVVYLVVMMPSIALVVWAKRPVPADGVTLYGVVASLAVVALVLTFLVSLAFLAGTALHKPLLAVVVLIFVWFPINLVLSTFSLEEFSPISLSQAMPTLLRTAWNDAEESPSHELTADDVKALSRQADQFLSILSGKSPPRDAEGSFFEKGDYEDFSLWRVGLGYGLPTLLALMLSAALFCWRDL